MRLRKLIVMSVTDNHLLDIDQIKPVTELSNGDLCILGVGYHEEAFTFFVYLVFSKVD